MIKPGMTIIGMALGLVLSGCTHSESDSARATGTGSDTTTTSSNNATKPPAAPNAVPVIPSVNSIATPPNNARPVPADHGQVSSSAAVASGLNLTAPTGWEQQTPGSSMRHSQYRLPGSAGDATLIVYYFGPQGAGSVDSNLDRWCGQFAQPDGRRSRDVAVMTQRTVNDMDVHMIDLTGTFVAETTPGSGVRLNEPDWRLLGAIIETRDGPYYLKLTGPAATAQSWSDSFTEYIDSAESGG